MCSGKETLLRPAFQTPQSEATEGLNEDGTVPGSACPKEEAGGGWGGKLPVYVATLALWLILIIVTLQGHAFHHSPLQEAVDDTL